MFSTKKSKKTGFSSRKTLGDEGEERALLYLKQEGFSLVERNYRCRGGEVDLIVSKKGNLHFVEVKTRRNDHYGAPEEAVSYYKQRKLEIAAHHFLLTHPKWQEASPCFSVVSIRMGEVPPKIEFFENAFEASF